MSSRDLGRAIDVLQSRIRQLIVPLHRVAEAIPAADRAVELGCGQGLLLETMLDRCRHVVGVDYDVRKIRLARERLGERPNLELRQEDITKFLRNCSAGSVDVILIADTLSSFPVSTQDSVLEQSISKLSDGGLLLLKIIDSTPRWKAAFSAAISTVVCRGLRLSLSRNQTFTYRPSTDYVDRLKGHGLETRVLRLDETPFHPISHVLIIGRKPA